MEEGKTEGRKKGKKEGKTEGRKEEFVMAAVGQRWVMIPALFLCCTLAFTAEAYRSRHLTCKSHHG
jgi:hypothetical protein